MKSSLSPATQRLLDEKVSSGRYQSADEVVRRGLTLIEREEAAGHATTPAEGSLAGIFADIAREVPAAEWEKVPTGLARNPEQYLYGAQKTS